MRNPERFRVVITAGLYNAPATHVPQSAVHRLRRWGVNLLRSVTLKHSSDPNCHMCQTLPL